MAGELVLHAVGKGLVEEARWSDCGGIIFEELNGNRDRLAVLTCIPGGPSVGCSSTRSSLVETRT